MSEDEGLNNEATDCDCFLIDAKTCATVMGLDEETCLCKCHKEQK